MLEDSLFFVDAVAKMKSVLADYEGKEWRVAYSGGADSDTVLWLLKYAGYEPKSVFYNTGIEYQATMRHLDYMRAQGFEIEEIKAKRAVPTSNRIYGHPFISKQVSEMISRLQRHNFDFQNHGLLSFGELHKMYPKCKGALRWWCNTTASRKNSISQNRYLKEFLIAYGVPFPVANMCCDGAKKLPVKDYSKKYGIELWVLGIRQSEGGVRAGIYKSCYMTLKKQPYNLFFPIYWINDKQKRIVDKELNIKHSDCYEVYGLQRTGCAGCPFGRNFEFELSVLNKYEPKLSKGIVNIFSPVYDWTRKYREFIRMEKTGMELLY